MSCPNNNNLPRSHRGCGTFRFCQFLLSFLILAAVTVEHVDAFGVVGRDTTSVRGVVLRHMADTNGVDVAAATADDVAVEQEQQTATETIAEAVDGGIYANGFLDNSKEDIDSILDATDKLLSKRVPVAIRYSADSGMKPYFLTVAKKLKEQHPDIILDKVILPKIEVSDAAVQIPPTFEVMVDGKVVIPTVGKKDREGMGAYIVYVSMQELELAITRARRRRRPSTVYGEEEANVRLEMLKVKAALASGAANHPSVRNSHKLSKD